MKTKNRRTLPTLLVAVIVIMLLPGLACNLFSAQPEEPEVVEEPVVVEEPEVIEEPELEVEPAFRPEQVLRLDFEEKVSSVAFSNDGDLIATGINNQADIWRVVDGSLVQSFEVQNSVDGLVFLPGDDAIAMGINVWHVYIFDVASGEEQSFLDKRGYDHSLALSPDGTRIASGNRDGITLLWDMSTGELIMELDPMEIVDTYAAYISDQVSPPTSKWLTAIAYSPDGRIVAVGHTTGYIFLWDANSGELIRTIEPEIDFSAVRSLAFSADGQYLAVGGRRHEGQEVIKAIQVSDGSLAYVLDQYTGGGSGSAPVTYSPDGTLLAAGATDGIYIWSLPDYELLHTIPIEDTGDSDWVTDLAFSPDSQYLLAGYWNDYAILWQVQE